MEFRQCTKEETAGINKYIDLISKPTGLKFDDLYCEDPKLEIIKRYLVETLIPHTLYVITGGKDYTIPFGLYEANDDYSTEGEPIILLDEEKT